MTSTAEGLWRRITGGGGERFQQVGEHHHHHGFRLRQRHQAQFRFPALSPSVPSDPTMMRARFTARREL
jgi:hypothetical protein